MKKITFFIVLFSLTNWAFSQNKLIPSRARALVAGYVENRRLTPAEKKALFGLCLFAATRFELTRVHERRRTSTDVDVRRRRQ